MRLVLLAALAVVALVVARELMPAAPPAPVANRAFLPVRADRPVKLWAVGDGADGGAAGVAVARMIEADRPHRLLYLGDVYENGTREEFDRNYHGVYGRLASRTAPTPGNHEWPNHPEGYDAYWASQTGRPTPPWYAFRAGGWEVLSLNTEAPHDEGSEQLRWLRRTVARPGTCRIAFWHRPLMSAGHHGDNPDVAPLWRALEGRARLVLTGHEHAMQRLHRRDGLTQYVSGAGGRERHDVREDDPRLAFAEDQSHGALRLVLRGDVAELTFVRADGLVLDRSRARCRR